MELEIRDCVKFENTIFYDVSNAANLRSAIVSLIGKPASTAAGFELNVNGVVYPLSGTRKLIEINENAANNTFIFWSHSEVVGFKLTRQDTKYPINVPVEATPVELSIFRKKLEVEMGVFYKI